MKTLLVTSLALGSLLNAAALAHAGVPQGQMATANPLVQMVQADCFALGEDVAAQKGGTLAKATPDTEGGQPVCRVVIVIPGKDGERPKREEIIIPQ